MKDHRILTFGVPIPTNKAHHQTVAVGSALLRDDKSPIVTIEVLEVVVMTIIQKITGRVASGTQNAWKMRQRTNAVPIKTYYRRMNS